MPVAATLYFSESNAAGPAVTDNISNINFGGVDLPDVVPANHPIVRPNLITPFMSYWKALRPRVFSLGDSLQINDFRFWKSSGVYVTEEIVVMSTPGTNTYAQPAQTLVAGGVNIITADPGGTNMFTHAGDTLPITVVDGIPFYAPYFYVQWRGNNSAGAFGGTPIGAVNQKTFVFTYAES